MIKVKRTLAPDDKPPHRLKDEVFMLMYWFNDRGLITVGTTLDRALTEWEFAVLEQGLVEFQASCVECAE